jgi:hypothetical protein
MSHLSPKNREAIVLVGIFFSGTLGLIAASAIGQPGGLLILALATLSITATGLAMLVFNGFPQRPLRAVLKDLWG